VFNVLLYLASDEGREPLPASEDVLVLEIAAGVIEFLSGRGDEVPTFDGRNWRNCWQQEVNNMMLNTLFGKDGNELNPELKSALHELTRLESCYSHGEAWWESSIRYYLMCWECINPVKSTFSLSVPFVEGAKRFFMLFPPDVKNQCLAIAEKMKLYIRRDIEQIRKRISY